MPETPGRALEAPASTDQQPRHPQHPREPEKLVLPAAAVQHLLSLALRTELGNAWWRGFVCAHGDPSWVAGQAWAVAAQDAAVVRVPPEE
jgi:hypothetical protein